MFSITSICIVIVFFITNLGIFQFCPFVVVLFLSSRKLVSSMTGHIVFLSQSNPSQYNQFIILVLTLTMFCKIYVFFF